MGSKPNFKLPPPPPPPKPPAPPVTRKDVSGQVALANKANRARRGFASTILTRMNTTLGRNKDSYFG
jgi:hypothetical protein|tara:strand:+ start:350 stop:550 length:201 start_codon:yes stop_codon:yes gene_type:complete